QRCADRGHGGVAVLRGGPAGAVRHQAAQPRAPEGRKGIAQGASPGQAARALGTRLGASPGTYPRRSLSDCVLTTVFSAGEVWNDDRNRHPGRNSAVTSPNGASASRGCDEKLCNSPRLLPSARISSWTCRKTSGVITSAWKVAW